MSASLSQILLRQPARATHEPLLRGRALRRGHLGVEFFLESFGAERLAALPAARIADHFPGLVVDGHRVGIGFDGELVPDVARRHAIAVAIESQSEIFVNQGFGNIAVVGREQWQGPQRLGLETIIGSLAGFAVLASVGDFLQPLARLRVDVAEIGEGAQRPEVLAHISDGAFDLTFLPGRGDMTGARDEIYTRGRRRESAD